MEKQNNNGLKILIAILIIVIIGLCVFIIFERHTLKSQNNITETKKYNEKNEDSEIDLTDMALKNQIDSKLTDILSNGYGLYDGNINDRFIRLTNYNYLNKDNLLTMSEETKLYTILTHLDVTKKFKNIDWNSVSKESVKAIIKNSLPFAAQTMITDSSIDYVTSISSEKVKEEYSKYFGDSVNLVSIITKSNDSLYCPMFIYDEHNNMFYRAGECGGTGYPNILVYKNKFTRKKDLINVYVNLGSTSFYGENANEIIFNDLIDTNNSNSLNYIYKDNLTLEEVAQFKIDDSNYKDFAEYVFSFKQDDNGNYYLTEIVKK